MRFIVPGVATIVGMMVLGLLFAPLATASSPNAPVLQETPTTTEPEAGITITDIIDVPEDFVGRTVTVTGNIAEVYAANTFRLDDESGNSLLVVNPLPDITVITEEMVGDPVEVTGIVDLFDAADIAQQYDLELVPELEQEFAGDPVIIAQAVAESAPEAAQAETATPETTGTAETPEATETTAAEVTETATTPEATETTAAEVTETAATPEATETTAAETQTTTAPAVTATAAPTAAGATATPQGTDGPSTLPTTAGEDRSGILLLSIAAVLILTLGVVLLLRSRRTQE